MISDMDEFAAKVLARLQNRCARVECCSYDIRKKAEVAFSETADENIVEEIMESLQREGYVNDLRYASAFAREKASLTGWGPVKIRFALAAKRIPDDIIRQALEELDDNASDKRLRSLLAAKWKNLTGPDGQVSQDAKLKLLKYALGRGYEYDVVRHVVESVINDG